MKKSTLIILIIGVLIVAGFTWFSVNASREVLKAFGEMEKAIQHKNYTVKKDNDSLLGTITDAHLRVKANTVDSLNSSFTAYIESIKQEMLGQKNPENYESTDKPSTLFFTEIGVSKKGEELIAKIDQLRKELLMLVETSELKTNIKNVLSTEQVHDRNGRRRDWLVYNFKDFPLVASITKLTQIQSDVSTMESAIYLDYLKEQ